MSPRTGTGSGKTRQVLVDLGLYDNTIEASDSVIDLVETGGVWSAAPPPRRSPSDVDELDALRYAHVSTSCYRTTPTTRSRR